MKYLTKFILLLLLILFSPKIVQADGQFQKLIKINYRHSLRIPDQNITIELFSDTQNTEIYKMKIETKAMVYSEANLNLNDARTQNIEEELMRWHEYYREINISEVVNIEREYFENIFNRLFEINIKKIVEENIPRGPVADGSSVDIQFGTNPSFISIGIGDPGRETGEIGKVDQIIKEIFEAVSLLEYYN